MESLTLQQNTNSFIVQPQLVVQATVVQPVVQPAVQMQPSSIFAVQPQSAVQPALQMAPPQPLVQTIDLQQETVEICLATDVWPKEKAKQTLGSSLLAP